MFVVIVALVFICLTLVRIAENIDEIKKHCQK